MFQKHGLLLVYDAGLMSQHLAVLPASSFTSLFIQFSGYTLSYQSPPKEAGFVIWNVIGNKGQRGNAALCCNVKPLARPVVQESLRR